MALNRLLMFHAGSWLFMVTDGQVVVAYGWLLMDRVLMLIDGCCYWWLLMLTDGSSKLFMLLMVTLADAYWWLLMETTYIDVYWWLLMLIDGSERLLMIMDVDCWWLVLGNETQQNWKNDLVNYDGSWLASALWWLVLLIILASVFIWYNIGHPYFPFH